jgi:hypothetical protein
LNYRIAISPEVASQILSASGSYEGVREGLGLELEIEIDIVLNFIAGNPRLYPREFGPVHRARVKRFNLIIFYTIVDETIVVVEVRDARRKPPDWKARGFKNDN